MDVDSDGSKYKGNHKYDYDLIVIGGGSGGISCAKEAAEAGAKVALFDFVTPTSHGTTWGLGGTCVNVGCIPKKIMHYAGLLGESMHDSRQLGWAIDDKPKFDWTKMIQTVGNYIKSINFGYIGQLDDANITYIKAFASFIDDHTIAYSTRKEKEGKATAQYILLAMGGRPRCPKIPGSELAITSDDIFWKKDSPGKTLCVGASYISLETAGFLQGMGFDVTVAVRSILLRGFDRDCAEFIGDYMDKVGVKFRNKEIPTKLEKLDNGKIKVTFKSTADPDSDDNDGNNVDSKDNSEQEEQKLEDVYDTVMFAIGRSPETVKLGLDKTGVILDSDSGKIRCSKEQTNIPHIFAVGDIVYGALELTPVAIQAGKLLARRLFRNEKNWMDYSFVPTTVFTPVEYSCVGYDEEGAGDICGDENVEVYHMKNNPLEHYSVERVDHKGQKMLNTLYFKVICNKAENNKVLGFHYCGPNAGEVMQGFALALRIGCKFSDLEKLIGIHPTCAEWFTVLTVTKSSGKSAEATAC